MGSRINVTSPNPGVNAWASEKIKVASSSTGFSQCSLIEFLSPERKLQINKGAN